MAQKPAAASTYHKRNHATQQREIARWDFQHRSAFIMAN